MRLIFPGLKLFSIYTIPPGVIIKYLSQSFSAFITPYKIISPATPYFQVHEFNWTILDIVQCTQNPDIQDGGSKNRKYS